MAEFDDLIGTGQTYTTMALWESARNISEAWTGDRIGRCLAEAFTGDINLVGGGDTGTTYWLRLTANAGAEHDGTTNTVSSVGNARTTNRGQIDQARVEVSWLEFNYGVDEENGDKWNILTNGIGAMLHHNLIGSENSNADDCWGIRIAVATGVTIYRNNIFWTSKAGIALNNGVNNRSLHNTLHRAGSSSGRPGILGGGSNPIVEATAVFDVDARGGINFNFLSGATLNNNASSDSTGEGLLNLTTSDELANPSVVASTLDMRLKDTSSSLYQASSTNYSTVTFPEIDVPISDRNITIPAGDWSIGADDIVSAASSTRNTYMGSDNILRYYVGSIESTKVYLGSTIIHELE